MAAKIRQAVVIVHGMGEQKPLDTLKRLDVPQKALTVNMGAETNVESLRFSNNALTPTLVSGQVQVRLSGQTFPVRTFASLRPPFSTQPAWLVNQPNVRTTQLRTSGLNVAQANARAQGITDASADAVTVELDALRYSDLLQARGLVGVRGAGYDNDGFCYVKRVTHSITPGSYKQRFSLARDGAGSTTPVVVP